MPITYAVATNTITVTAFTEAVPCNFTDLWNADKAGTLSLHARVGIAAIDGAAVAVDRAERPTDYVILGGASGDLYIAIANWAGMINATIQIVGTDRDGAAQVENIAVNAAGNWPTTLWFRTITTTQVTVFNGPGGSFDYGLTQGQWGIIWKQEDAFLIECYVVVGDGVTGTWFADTKKAITLKSSTANWQNLILVKEDATFRLGEAVTVGDKTSKEGCYLSHPQAHFSYAISGDVRKGIILLYSSMFVADSLDYINASADGSRIWNCLFISGFRLLSLEVDLYRTVHQDAVSAFFSMRSPLTIDDLLVTEMTGEAMGKGSPVQETIWNMTARNNPRIYRMNQGGSVYWTKFINADSDNWQINWQHPTSLNIIYRQNTFDLRIVDASGVGIPGATAAMVDRLGAGVFSVATDANGDIVQQIVDYGYYQRPTGDAIQPGGLGYSPHTLTLSLAGYITRTIVYTMDRAREEIEELLLKGLKKTVEGKLLLEINSVGDLLRIAP